MSVATSTNTPPRESSRHSASASVPGTFGVALLYAVLTIVLAYPLSIRPADRVLSTSADTDLFLWTLSWDVHALAHQPWSIFDANIFYPQHHTLAYSENLIGSAVLAAPILWVTGNAVLALNAVVLFSCVLCGLGCYLLARRLGLSADAGVLAGLVFAFAPPRFLRLDQPFLATVEWIPFCLAFLHTYLERGRKGDLRLAAGFFTAQALTSGHGAVFLAVAVLLLIAYRLTFGERLAVVKRLVSDLGVPGTLLLAPVVLEALPYRAVQVEMGLRRSLDDWRILDLRTLLAAPTYVQTFLLSRVAPGAQINERANAWPFPGWMPLLLAAVALLVRRTARSDRKGTPWFPWWSSAAAALDAMAIAGLSIGLVAAVTGQSRFRAGELVVVSTRQVWRPWVVAIAGAAGRLAIIRQAPLSPLATLTALSNRVGRWYRTRQLSPTAFYAWLVVLSVWLAVGPPYSLWPFVYWLPGFSFIRVSSRFTLLGVLGIGVLAGTGFDSATARWDAARRRLASVVVGALIVVECLVPLGGIEYRVDPPAADRWLAAQPKPFVVAEVPLPPLSHVAELEKQQSTYMLHSTAHWQKTVHGWSGFNPAPHLDLYAALGQFPDEDSIRLLTEFAVDYVVVHRDLYPPDEWLRVERRIQSFNRLLTLAYSDLVGQVYALRRPTK